MFFWVLSAGLIVMVLVILALGVFRPQAVPATAAAAALLIYKDQLAELARDHCAGRLAEETYVAAKLEVERRMLVADEADGLAATGPKTTGYKQQMILLAVLAILLFVAAPAMYLKLGRPGLADQPFSSRAEERAEAAKALAQQEMIEGMVAGLAERLKAAPDDLDGWLRLSRSYMVMRRFGEAVKALQQAADLAPERTDILVAWSEAVLASAPIEAAFPEGFAAVIRRIERLQPDHPRALFFLGEIAAREGDAAAARNYWQRLLARLPKDSPLGVPLKTRIDGLPDT